MGGIAKKFYRDSYGIVIFALFWSILIFVWPEIMDLKKKLFSWIIELLDQLRSVSR